MKIINGEELSLITCCRQQECLQQSRKYVPEEIWFEIFSRLPIKSLLISRCVCKLWRNIIFTLGNKIDTDPMYIPVCGLFLTCLTQEYKYAFSYICLRTKTCSITQCSIPENNLYCSSGFESGLLTDLSFDFSIIYKFTTHARDERVVSFIVSGGLIVVAFAGGIWEVHNPATKQIYLVPRSPTTAKYGFKHHKHVERPGLIIKLTEQKRGGFIFVIFCTELRIMEVYYSMTRIWKKYDLTLDAQVMMPDNYWRASNYVVCNQSGVLCLYVLTNKCLGVAVKFEASTTNSIMDQYCFPLPEAIVGYYTDDTRFWGCENSLYLSYYKDGGLYIWKAGCTQVDAWEWVPLIEINPAASRQWWKTVTRKHLSEMVLGATGRVIVLAWHPDVPVMYLLVKSSVFAYNLNTDTLDMIWGAKDDEDLTNSRYYCAVTYKPFLNFMDAGEELPSNVCERR